MNNNNNNGDDDSVCATSNMCYDELKTKFMLISILIKNKRSDRVYKSITYEKKVFRFS